MASKAKRGYGRWKPNKSQKYLKIMVAAQLSNDKQNRCAAKRKRKQQSPEISSRTKSPGKYVKSAMRTVGLLNSQEHTSISQVGPAVDRVLGIRKIFCRSQDTVRTTIVTGTRTPEGDRSP